MLLAVGLKKDKLTNTSVIAGGNTEWVSTKALFLIDEDADYIADLKTVANYYGHSPGAIDDFWAKDFHLLR